MNVHEVQVLGLYKWNAMKKFIRLFPVYHSGHWIQRFCSPISWEITLPLNYNLAIDIQLQYREKLNSMNLLLYMSPIAVLVLLPSTLIMEPNVLEATLLLGREHKFLWLLLFLNSATAYAANLTNFLVTKHTSALTLQVWHAISLFSLL